MSTGNVVVSQNAPSKNNLWIQPKGTARFWNGNIWKEISGSGGGGGGDLSNYYTKSESDDRFLKLSGGTLVGTVRWTNAALLEKTSPDYFLTIDSFSNGGTTYWTSTADTITTFDNQHRWVRVTGDTMTGLLGINTNSNTVTIGSQNSSWCHIYNSAAIPFIFNNTVAHSGTCDDTTGSLGTASYPWHRLILGGNTNATMSASTTNPRITFQEGTGTQPVHLVYTDYDSYRSPAGLKVLGNGLFSSGSYSSPAWFEVEGSLYIGNSTSTSNTISLQSSACQMKLLAYSDSNCYIECGNSGWTGNINNQILYITGHNGNAMSNIELKATTTHCSNNFYATGGVTALSAGSSDKRLKKNIKPFNAFDIINKLNPVQFEWNKKANKYNNNLKLGIKNYGLIAQDSDNVIDEFVFDLPDNSGYKGIKYEKLISVLLQAIKEQNEKIENLEYEINVLKGIYK